MLNRKVWLVVAAVAIATLFMVGQAVSQETRPGRGGRGGPGGRGNFDPNQMRKAMMDQMQKDLGASDEEWKALEPKIEKVMTLSRAARGGMMMGMMGRGGPGARGPGRNGGATTPPAAGTARQPSDVEKKMGDLQKVLENKDAKAADLKSALSAYREAREKAKTDLAKAQKDLQDVVTVRQEALLVARGLLD